ncbi:hypothetical protein Acy02nite_57900 [Actinoplanes cyaneus]|uniref:FtsX-like permease family protein n=1 Tax=Actinoplanes cyaneus TaxID=52696 RepID=A0A919M9U7_9ACTN|nr:hypothetical protein Acy02nite_57900 [Actinoplanes cyaneus]
MRPGRTGWCSSATAGSSTTPAAAPTRIRCWPRSRPDERPGAGPPAFARRRPRRDERPPSGGALATTVGLIRSETARDLRTLTAAGARRRTRRALTASTAGALALAGALLGAAGAYLALLAWHHRDAQWLTPVPLTNLAAILAGLPLLAYLGAWVLAGREPATLARPALE